MTFHGTPRADHHAMDHVHESPVDDDPALRAGGGGGLRRHLSLLRGFRRRSRAVAEFWGAIDQGAPTNEVPIEHAHHVPGWVKLLPLVMAGMIGIGSPTGLYIRNPQKPRKIAAALRP